MEEVTFLGAHGTTSNIAQLIQKEGFKIGNKGFWSKGCYFFSEKNKMKSKKCACAWAHSTVAQRKYGNDSSDKVCIFAKIRCKNNLYLNLEVYKKLFKNALRDVERYCESKKLGKQIENELKNKQQQYILNTIVKDLNLTLNDVVLRAFIPFPEGSGKNYGYCLVVKDSSYIQDPPYEVIIC